MARPCAVTLPAASSAPSRRSRSRALASVAAGGASSQRSALASRSPHREVERQRREIGDADFRRRVRRETALRALAPQPVAHARRGAARAARALLGRRARDALHLEPVHAARRIEQAAPLEPRIDDDAHAVDGETGLGDVGGEHDLAPPGLRGLERRVLVAGRELAEQRHHVDVGADVAQHALHAADLARAGQEHQHVARRFAPARA